MPYSERDTRGRLPAARPCRDTQQQTKDYSNTRPSLCFLAALTGTDLAGSISVGTTVFGGMIAATTLNLLFIPVLYVLVRSIGKATPAPAGNK